MLGDIIAVTELVRVESIKSLISERFAEEFHETNYMAVDLGVELVQQFQSKVTGERK
jgi:Pyruvate/2-oxoacid:ferredoxin oxidoreductase gamma subunit